MPSTVGTVIVSKLISTPFFEVTASILIPESPVSNLIVIVLELLPLLPLLLPELEEGTIFTVALASLKLYLTLEVLPAADAEVSPVILPLIV